MNALSKRSLNGQGNFGKCTSIVWQRYHRKDGPNAVLRSGVRFVQQVYEG